MTNSVPAFLEHCREVLEPFLLQYGYMYVETHCRPRGIAVEFAKDNNTVFAACEGDVLYVDLILHRSDEEYFRISLNQALWYNDVKSVVGPISCEAQLDVFVREMEQIDSCKQLFCDDQPKIDDRYSFPMTPSSWWEYLSAQRGK